MNYDFVKKMFLKEEISKLKELTNLGISEGFTSYPQINIYPKYLGDCIRKHYYQIIDPISYNFSNYQIKRMGYGHDRHNFYLKIWEKKGILNKEKTKKLDKLHGVNGYPDAILNIDGVELVVEIKTISEYFLKYIFRMGGYILHLYQLGYYMGRLGLPGLFLYEQEGTFKDNYLPCPNGYATLALEKAFVLSEHLKNKTLPDREFKIKSTQCVKCLYKRRCWSDER